MIRTIKFKTEPGDWTVIDDKHGLCPYLYKWERRFARQYLHRAVRESIGTKMFFKGSKNMFAVWKYNALPITDKSTVLIKVFSGKDAK